MILLTGTQWRITRKEARKRTSPRKISNQMGKHRHLKVQDNKAMTEQQNKKAWREL